MAKILLGLDIGMQSIKAVQISKDKSTSTLLAAGYIATPTKAYLSQTAADEQELANTVNRLVHDMKVSTADVSASLPTSKVITRVIEVPNMSDEELSSSIQWEAEQFIPMPLVKVKIDYAVIDKSEDSKKMKILLVAAPIAIVERYMRVITAAGLNPVSLETEILADSRCITHSFPTLTNVLIVTFGASNTEIALLHDQILIYTKSYPIGGTTLTRTIAEELGFELPQAEEYKKTYGLDEDKLEGKIGKTITSLFTNLFTEMEKTVGYFKEQYPKEELKTAIISGGGAKLPGLVLSITKNLSIDSQINNPFTNLSVDPNILPTLSPDAPIYTTVVGLALKDVT
ncbi:type IV pilus assembly protein PilM [Candidatus Gottesmanbacteria bacterium]|nr:type IV pilus assembly protein PilM [Candidatus Gottesmanbacteria bacterium]MBI5452746.1 type IV pilus assembly protein PilM [Candidatus Gottesmanbacteria bacterium]